MEAPELEKAYLSYKDKGVAFIWVFVMSKDQDIKEFAETYKLTFPVGKDNGIVNSLSVRGIPTALFINKDRKVVKKHHGVIDYSELVSGIEAILK